MTRSYRITLIVLFVFVPAAFLLSLFSVLRISQADGTTVLCVVPEGASTGPFAACSDVFTSVQAAVDDALGGEEIWVASGVYTDVHFTKTMTQIVYLDKALTLRGGYTIPFTTSPDPAANSTILNAERRGRVLVVTGTAVLIEGFQMTGGNGEQDASDSHVGNGGGVFAANAVLTVTKNSIYDNVAALYEGGGGGVWVENSWLTFTNNDVYSNTAVTSFPPMYINSYGSGVGGGIVIWKSRGGLHANTIRNNMASLLTFGYGGGIYIFDSSYITLTHNRIVENMGGYEGGTGGGIDWTKEGTNNEPTNGFIAHNVISGNIAAMTSDNISIGGGMSIILPYYPHRNDTHFTIVDNDIISNTALVSSTSSYGGLGGGLVVAASPGNFAFSHNRILSNTATGQSTDDTISSGGGVLIGAGNMTFDGDLIQYNQLGSKGNSNGIGFIEGSVVTMTNVVVADNLDESGSEGIGIYNSQVTLRHPTIVRNGDRGVFVHYEDDYPEPDLQSHVLIYNAILAGHDTGIVVSRTQTLTVDGVLWHDTNFAVAIEPGANVTIDHQVVGDPRFAADGFHLTEDSAAIGQGVPLIGVFSDIDGDGRLSPPALGADEYLPFKQILPLIFKK